VRQGYDYASTALPDAGAWDRTDEAEDTGARMHSVTLRFDDPLESEFADEYFERTLPQVRVAILLGLFLYVAFGALDAYIAPNDWREVWIIRYAVEVPTITALLAFSYTRAFRRYHQLALSGTIVVAGLGLMAMIAIMEPPGSFVYYAGLLLCMMFMTLTRLTLPNAAIVAAVLVAMYVADAAWSRRTAVPLVVSNVSFLVATVLVSMMANYSIERYARVNFLQRRLIMRHTRELEEKNAQLTIKNQLLAESRAETLRTARRSELIFSALSEALPGTVLDEKYRIEEKIGAGNFGTVYRGEHILLNHLVAIKVFRPAIGDDAHGGLERFRLEGISACRVNHPNAVSVLDFNVSAECLAYLVMELLEGHSLADELGRVGKLSPGRSAQIAACVCDVLAEAHGQGILHRDIKPSNVFLQSAKGEQRVKVIDFGIAKLTGDNIHADARASTTGTWVGSPAYMAPERFRGETCDGRADVYAVGVLLYEALTGMLPHGSSSGDYWSRAMLEVAAPPPAAVVPTIPAQLDVAVTRAMAFNPVNRPSAAELAAELRECARVCLPA
jgi:hypothetical protein